jgi:phospholipid-binding lipoprotein MlaA
MPQPTPHPRWRSAFAVLALGVAAALAGCATGPNRDPRDPIEPFNRGVEQFNDTVDKAVLKPVATVYAEVTPDPVRTAVGNFFGNLRDVWTVFNATLQLRGEDAATSFLRVGVNTAFGLGSLLGIATEMRATASADFGQTMGCGVCHQARMVLPCWAVHAARHRRHGRGGRMASGARHQRCAQPQLALHPARR